MFWQQPGRWCSKEPHWSQCPLSFGRSFWGRSERPEFWSRSCSDTRKHVVDKGTTPSAGTQDMPMSSRMALKSRVGTTTDSCEGLSFFPFPPARIHPSVQSAPFFPKKRIGEEVCGRALLTCTMGIDFSTREWSGNAIRRNRESILSE